MEKQEQKLLMCSSQTRQAELPPSLLLTIEKKTTHTHVFIYL